LELPLLLLQTEKKKHPETKKEKHEVEQLQSYREKKANVLKETKKARKEEKVAVAVVVSSEVKGDRQTRN
jgi:hypothetical protein